ncbi:putative CAMP-dependent protein kinase regulatory subunit [Neospora caninum Liverpool]|uniref:cAMP-dependent protein kinase regulatory subunit n=1 Tax=Neospora caninum (strain Liverpool) TaxID=572307 RepID=F0VN01_NEOCL|nr:putative CAMP-dependent protein kinase regulatory subunit [Neospora caninum Liverpool]CBZ55097.1 putative CAMP-dependent protein kinase regulatory subunit [Neospora caninum Liverpool]CEL69823.1 TPA: CAMP-dependent protein kinase regulatory subunit,putative [Neospora caninum Liverpool]|eukprot:XP_003885125.1 putative CAMP-dependent protein kinase regulatory subunit [Neospora caninum Liverpool]
MAGATAAYQEYINTKLNPILEGLVVEVLLEHPDDPVTFMISRLCQRAGIPDPVAGAAGGKSEAEELKVEISLLREQLGKLQNAGDGSPVETHESDESDEEQDDAVEDDDDEAVMSRFKNLNKMRCSVSAEVYGEWNKKKNFVAPVYEKDEDQKERLERILRQSFLFNSLDEKDLNTVILAMQEKKIEANTRLICEGDDGECLYIVESGELNCSKLLEGEEKVVKVVGPGDAFGELALLYNAPRAATVTSVTACDLWELGRDTFNAIVKDAATKRRSMYDAFLKSVHILDGMDAYERGKVADALRTEMFTDGAYIVRQGELGDIFYIVEEGSAIATKSFGPGQPPIEVKKYQAGDYFGELALINGEPRAANVIAQGICKVACLERKSFKRLMGSVQDLLSKKASEYKRESD